MTTIDFAKHGGLKTTCTGLLLPAILGGALLHAGLDAPLRVIPYIMKFSVHVVETGNPSSQKDYKPNSAPELSCKVTDTNDPS